MNYKIKEISQIVNGSTPSTSNSAFWNGNIIWITPKDLTNFSERYIYKGHINITQEGYKSCSTKLVPKGTILLSSRAPIGYIAIAGNELCTNQGFKSIICNEKVNNFYLYYWLLKNVDYLKSISSGATFKELSKDTLENVEINLPSLTEQQHIVNTIGTLDDLIENITNQNNKILEIIENIFSNLKESNIMLKDICEIKYGKSITASKLDNNNKYLVYGGNGIIGTLDDFMFDKSKISISCRGAASGNILLTTPFSTISSNSLYLNLYDESLTLPLYSFLLKAGLNNYVTGSAQPQITIENIQSLKVPILDDYKNNNYDSLIALINNNKEKLNKLNLIKQDLLSKYF